MEQNHLTYYSDSEEMLNVFTHAFGLLLSIVALIFLIFKAKTTGMATYVISFTIFGISLILLYAASTFYHAAKKPALRAKLNILDHAAIYVLIAGTYTPFSLITLKGWIGWTVFTAVWSIAAIGIVLKLFFTGRFDKLSTISYVTMGWVVIFAIKPLIKQLSIQGLFWLALGGIIYTVGAVLYGLQKLPYNHCIFHVLVLLGSLAHFIAIYFYV